VNSLKTHRVNDNASYSSFSTESGCDEVFVTLRTSGGISPAQALAELNSLYTEVLASAKLTNDTVLFSRLFVSDSINQQEAIRASKLCGRLKLGALSVIEQKPAGSGPLSLFSYHARRGTDPVQKKISGYGAESWSNTLLAAGKNYKLLFTANFTSDTPFDACRQTSSIFNDIDTHLKRNAMNLLGSTVRTWIFVRDVDNHYKNMVAARREYFTAQGLTDKTRYLASTWIEGRTFAPGRIVDVDSLSIGGLVPGQIVRMEAPTHLSPTIVYGVTFERGLRVRFGDRSHLHISGTASINNKGEVLHTGNVEEQTQRTLENVRALLEPHGASLSDMAYLLVYVRNFHDIEAVKGVLRREIGAGTPVLLAEAAVCRPTWLMEIEGVAVIPDDNQYAPFF
jgi:enamine deaminase RidA (YjgF/YER057c/UK114 family)